jgi:ribosomal protein L12E/L44/L45/RPP1/RPP2
MKEMAAYLMLVLGGNTSPTADDVTTALSTVGVEPDSEQLGKLISELEGKDLDEVLASGETMLAKFGSGGGGGGGGGGKFSSYIFVEFRSCIASLLSALS